MVPGLRHVRKQALKILHQSHNGLLQNRTEVEIRELKHHVRRLMARTKTPTTLWDFGTFYATDLRNRLAIPLHQLHGCIPYEMLIGNTPDISEFLEYEWYQPVWYFEPTAFPNQRKILARWIGVTHRVGQAMCYWSLPQSGISFTRTAVQPLREIELQTDDFKEQLKAFDAILGYKIASLVENPKMRMHLMGLVKQRSLLESVIRMGI